MLNQHFPPPSHESPAPDNTQHSPVAAESPSPDTAARAVELAQCTDHAAAAAAAAEAEAPENPDGAGENQNAPGGATATGDTKDTLYFVQEPSVQCVHLCECFVYCSVS